MLHEHLNGWFDNCVDINLIQLVLELNVLATHWTYSLSLLAVFGFFCFDEASLFLLITLIDFHIFKWSINVLQLVYDGIQVHNIMLYLIGSVKLDQIYVAGVAVFLL